jgi:hypothetical protein
MCVLYIGYITHTIWPAWGQLLVLFGIEKIDAWTGRVARMGEMRIAYVVLVRKSEGKRLVGGPSLRGKKYFGIIFKN